MCIQLVCMLEVRAQATAQRSSLCLEDVLAVLHEGGEVVHRAVGARSQFRELGLVDLLDLWCDARSESVLLNGYCDNAV